MSDNSQRTAPTEDADWGDLVRHPIVLTCRVVLLTFVGGMLFVFHGLSFHLTPWSQAFINAIVKHVYPTTGQDQTTVLLFREANLHQLGTRYPVPYNIHAQILESLAFYRPRALFVDFAFFDQRAEDNVDELVAKFCLLRESGTKVFLAAPSARESDQPVHGKLFQCAQPASPQMDETVGVSGVLTYPRGENTGQRFLPSAAFAMALSNADLGLDPQDRADLEIVWGKGVAPLNHKWMKCPTPSFFQVVKDTLFHGPLATKMGCPYSRTLDVNQLLNSAGDKDVSSAINGKTVFYGAAFRLTGDRVDSPVYQEMPGVYLHAMAYDNLATFKAHYKRVGGGKYVVIGSWLILLLSSLLLVFFPREEEKSKTRPDLIIKLFYPLLFVAFFLAGCLWDGIDGGLLVLFGAYVLFRTAIVKDRGFVIQVVVTLAFALIAYMALNLGPQNVFAFFVFFEVVRQIQHWLKEKSREYVQLDPVTPSGKWSNLAWKAADKVSSLYAPSKR